MNTSVRARHDARGFSLVELLVTIVIAGIVFAAMVPMFVSASQASSRDRVRNVATQVAQGRIESLRLLGFAQLSDSNAVINLQNNAFPGLQFGSTYSPPSSSAVYHVDYIVTNVPSTGVANYVRVSVSVTTPSPPSPPYTATMATIVLNPAATSSSSSPSPSPSPTTASAPTITSFTPATGSAGTSVTLTGTGFSSATAVGFNGTGATFSAVSDTRITATVPTSATSGAISVTNPVGTATSTASFTVLAPTSGPYSLTVEVSGGNWVNPTSGVTVTQTNVTPKLVRTPTPQFPATSSNVQWSGLAAGEYLVTCNYYKNGKTNGNGPKTVVQTVTITTSDQQISFDLTQ